MEAFAAGDVVRFHRGEYSHVALYVGGGRVIHLWSPTSARAFCVRIDSIRHVQNCQRTDAERFAALDEEADARSGTAERYTEQMDAKMQQAHGAAPFDGDEVVRRARTRLGETQYDYLSYNCEHFVTWARYGVGASPQAASHTNQVLAGALLGAAVAGVAGLVVGGMISLFSKVNALSASSGGLHADEDSDEYHSADEESSSQHESVESVNELHDRREERERLLEDITNMQLEEHGGLGEFEQWTAARHQRLVRPAARTYSEDRHNALASRLADDKLLCGICFHDLQLTRAVAFFCDHFTCTKCHDALVTNAAGHKCCPYCRMNITDVQLIHRSTKQAARNRLTWEEEAAAASSF